MLGVIASSVQLLLFWNLFISSALGSFRYRLCKEGIISQGHHDESVLKAENHRVHSELSKSSTCSSVDSKASLASGEEQLKSNSLETRLACSEESDPTHREAQRV
jgi:hypothetical protein